MNKIINFTRIVFLVLLSIQFVAAQNDDYLILLSWDGCRWDYLNRGVTPNVQKLIDEGVRAESMQPSYPSKTFPNHYTLVTGLYPQNHGIVFNRLNNVENGESYRIKKDSSIHEDKWYKGESLWMTAKKHGIKSGAVFWPGSETYIKHPNYFRAYDHHLTHEKRIKQLMDWINLPEEERPHLMMLYFPDTDDAGHKYGPDSDEVNSTLNKLDSTLGNLVNELKEAGIYNKTNIVLVSDHGMTNVDERKGIDLQKMLSEYKFIINGNDPNLTFFADDSQINEMYAILKKNENGYNVYRKEEIPENLHVKNSPFVGQIIVMAKPGYYFKSKWKPSKGAHGFDNKIKDMHAVFVAHGPAFKKGYQTNTIKNIDIYPLLCKALGINQNSDIDGSLLRVENLLKQ